MINAVIVHVKISSFRVSDFSGVRGRGARGYCAVREGIAVKTVWLGLAIHTDSPMSAARIAEVLVEHQRSGLCVKVPKSLAR